MAVVVNQIDHRIDIFNKTQALSRLLSARYKQVPAPPKCKSVLRIYPQIVSQKKFSWALALGTPFILVGISIILTLLVSLGGVYRFIPEGFLFIFPNISLYFYYFAIAWIPLYCAVFKRRKENDIKKVRDSVEYYNHCIALDKKYDELQEKANAEYIEKQREYETEVLPKYHKDLEEWTLEHSLKIEKAKQDIEIAKAILVNL